MIAVNALPVIDPVPFIPSIVVIVVAVATPVKVESKFVANVISFAFFAEINVSNVEVEPLIAVTPVAVTATVVAALIVFKSAAVASPVTVMV